MNVIEFDGISKQYRLGSVGAGTLSSDLSRWWAINVLHKEDPRLRIGELNNRAMKGGSDYVWALKDISFDVEQGDVLGIIGRNGAGKSTLLKLLSKVTSPTTGEIRTRGRIGTLLEVGTGFHPEMTGRENIYMNGAILGMTKREITAKLDEIVDFSGCERYIDTPVKRYSSGMAVRLGFAVAAHLEPEILVVDEVLAVGDAEFQKKAIGKMKDVAQQKGRTVLFVSHNMAAVKNLCTRCVVLENGMKVFDGGVDEAVDFYASNNITEIVDHVQATDKHRHTRLARELEYIDLRMLNDIRNVATNEPLEFEVTFRRNNPSVRECQVGVVSRNSRDIVEWTCYSPVIELPENGEQFKARVSIPCHNTAMGKHLLNFNLSRYEYSAINRNYDLVFGVLSFEVNYVDAEHTQPFTSWPFTSGTSIHTASIRLINSDLPTTDSIIK